MPWCDVIYNSSAWDLARMLFTQSQCTVLYTHASLKPRIGDLTLRECSPDAPSELLEFTDVSWAVMSCVAQSPGLHLFVIQQSIRWQLLPFHFSQAKLLSIVIFCFAPPSAVCWGSELVCLHHIIPLHLLLRKVLFKMLCVIPFMINEQLDW